MSLYNVIIIGRGPNNEAAKLKRLLRNAFKELGIDHQRHVQFLDTKSVSKRDRMGPSVVAFLGPTSDRQDIIAVTQLIGDGVPVIPAVADLKTFNVDTPPVLHSYNGIEIGAGGKRLSALASAMMEWLGLFKRQRRLFLSYLRRASRSAALQLHDRLQEAGFDVFLDTHSIRPGEDFQAVLMHRLADCEVMVLIDTPTFLESRWTVEELARANLQTVGILQVVWPGHEPPRKSPISEKLYLDSAEVLGTDGPLQADAVERIIVAVEKLRASAVATRTAALAGEFRKEAEAVGAHVYTEPNRTLRTVLKNGTTLIAVPTIGVPTAEHYHDVFEAAHRITTERPLLVYDQIGVLERWTRHLNWLDEYLPVNTLKVTDTWRRLR